MPIQLEDTLALRVDVLKLVVPPDCVVTDRTAGWLWGALMILAPNDHLQTPRVSVLLPARITAPQRAGRQWGARLPKR